MTALSLKRRGFNVILAQCDPHTFYLDMLISHCDLQYGKSEITVVRQSWILDGSLLVRYPTFGPDTKKFCVLAQGL
jgi:hypothetical protein